MKIFSGLATLAMDAIFSSWVAAQKRCQMSSEEEAIYEQHVFGAMGQAGMTMAQIQSLNVPPANFQSALSC